MKATTANPITPESEAAASASGTVECQRVMLEMAHVATCGGFLHCDATYSACTCGWKLEIEPDALPVESVAICPECGLECPDDDRVAAGMKCGICAYANLSIGQAYERDRNAGTGQDDF